MKIRPFDVLAAVGLTLFIVFARLFTFERFLRHRGEANTGEFYVYAVFILIILGLIWKTFRKYDWKHSVLYLTAVGYLLHCVGCIPLHEGIRVYDLVLGGVRFDKGVHFFTAFVAVRVILEITKFEGVSIGRLEGIAVVLMTLGVGASWEIIEFFVASTIPHNGVGYYNNNMSDLVANLAGATLSMSLRSLQWRLRRSGSRAIQQKNELRKEPDPQC